MRFQGQFALVTGAAGGIGRAIVAGLLAEGAAVAVTDRDTSGMQGVARFDGDLRDPGFCADLPGRAAHALGGLTVLVNNAGVITRGKLPDSTEDDLALTLDVNVAAPTRLCRAAIPIMAAGGGGAIVNTCSCWGLSPGPDHPLYIMSKAALASLTRCLARDHAAQGIRVNGVAPNEVNTPMLRTGFAIRGLDPDTGIAALNDSVPLGRIAEPGDIADVILWLASDAARYVTGAIVEAHGGKAVA